MNHKQILTAATDVGYMLLKNGAEVYRAEQSIEYICKSYGVDEVDVFAIPSSIVVTISFGDDFISKSKRLSGGEIDLEKVCQLNELSRYICENQPTYQQIQDRLHEIAQIKPYSLLHRTVAFALIGCSFTVLFGGSMQEGILGFLLGAIVSGISTLSEKRNLNQFLKIEFCSFVISLVAVACSLVSGGAINSTNIISGTLMILVPGLALTNCMRDYMAKDFMSGTAKLSEALMTALATALGVAIVLLSISGWGAL